MYAVAVIPVLCRSLEQAGMFLRGNFSNTQLYKYNFATLRSFHYSFLLFCTLMYLYTFIYLSYCGQLINMIASSFLMCL